MCAYDRAGLAWSDAASLPRTFGRILDDLGAVVATLGTGPWAAVGAGRRVILVGHSFGSLVQAHWSQPKCFHAMAGYLGVLQAEAATMAAAVPPPDIPVVVISGAHQPASELAAHRDLAAASPHGRHLVAVRSGHWILLDEPELIVDAVRALLPSPGIPPTTT